MSSAKSDADDAREEDSVSYRPGSFRYQDLPTDQRRRLFDDRQRELNPCLKESEIASACLLMHADDQKQCAAETENYKTCKRFWAAVRSFATTHHLFANDGFPPLSQRPIWKKQLRSWIETKKLTIPDEIKPLI